MKIAIRRTPQDKRTFRWRAPFCLPTLGAGRVRSPDSYSGVYYHPVFYRGYSRLRGLACTRGQCVFCRYIRREIWQTRCMTNAFKNTIPAAAYWNTTSDYSTRNGLPGFRRKLFEITEMPDIPLDGWENISDLYILYCTVLYSTVLARCLRRLLSNSYCNFILWLRRNDALHKYGTKKALCSLVGTVR